MRHQSSTPRDVLSWSAAILIVAGSIVAVGGTSAPTPRVPPGPPPGPRPPEPPVVVVIDPVPPVVGPEPVLKPTPAPPTIVAEENSDSTVEDSTQNKLPQTEPPRRDETAPIARPAVDDPFEREPGLPESAPVATAVEANPKPLDELTPVEVIDHVTDYRMWCEEGQISIVLRTEQLTSEQIDSLVDFYVLDDSTHTVFVDRAGRRFKVDESTQRAGFEGDLLKRSRWSNRLRAEAERQFGPNHAAKASFRLAPRPTLVLYRLLGEELGAKAPPPGTCVTLRLVPGRDGRLLGEVIDVQRPRQATR